MFDADRQRIVAELRRHLAGNVPTGNLAVDSTPTDLSQQKMLAVPGPLVELFPHGGIPRGAVVSLGGSSGATSLLFSLLAAPPNAWSALVGMPDIGLLAAAELGVELNRLVLIPEPGPDLLQVLSILADGVDIIAVAPPRATSDRATSGGAAGFGGTPARQRVLAAKLRQSGAVMLVTGQWPGADLVLNCRIDGWTGVGRGHGRLRDRELMVEVTGRRAAGRRRTAAMLLRCNRSKIDIATVPNRLAATHGLDVDHLDVEPAVAVS